MLYDGLDAVQINDGLNETAACAGAAVYDRANGLMFVSYVTGLRKRYGESTGKLCLSVFPPGQPTNVRHRVIDIGIGESRGLLCTAHYLVGDGRTRMLFTTTRGELAAYYRDYDFFSDTVSERTEVFFRGDEGDVRLDNASYLRYVNARGFSVDSTAPPIVNKVFSYQGKFQTAVTLDSFSYAVLCTIEDNVLVPFAVASDPTTYEFRCCRNDDGIYAVFRIPPDGHGTGHGGYTVSRDGGTTWETTVFPDGIQSRPDVFLYRNEPMVVYNYKSDREILDFPPMHNHRNAVRFLYRGAPVLELFSKYGIVEHETVPIAGDLYFAFSNCPQALSTENGAAWIEEGRPVEQGKEALQWAKLPDIGEKIRSLS